jgi:hypothetical protein
VQNGQNIGATFLGSDILDENNGRAGKQMKWAGRNCFYITVLGKTK